MPAPDWEPEVRGPEGEPVEHTDTEPQPLLREELEPVAVDELAAEIAQIGADEAVVADYGAGLDDLVSKYPFRKVEHWYELPGFDTPAPPASDPADQADDAAPSHGATAEPT